MQIVRGVASTTDMPERGREALNGCRIPTRTANRLLWVAWFLPYSDGYIDITNCIPSRPFGCDGLCHRTCMMRCRPVFVRIAAMITAITLTPRRTIYAGRSLHICKESAMSAIPTMPALSAMKAHMYYILHIGTYYISNIWHLV